MPAAPDPQAGRLRLPPDARRRQILRAAARVLDEEGADAVLVTRVADAAGVSRPVVYRFFAGRTELLVGVLEAFEAALGERFAAGPAGAMEAPLGEVAAAFVEAVCDTIEAWGAGTWHLLDARGPDPAVAAAAAAIRERLVAPWRGAMAAATGAGPLQVLALSRMIVAAGRAALDPWLDGTLSRDDATALAARGVAGLLAAFGAGRGG